MQENQLYQLITKYLQSKENLEEKKKLYDWYENHSHGNDLEDSQIFSIEKNAKKRLFKSISKENKTQVSKNKYAWIASAAAILLIGYFAWNYSTLFSNQEKKASESYLATIQPAKEHAIITLDNGKEIDLDKLALNEKLKVDNIIISKDERGNVVYLNSSGEQEITKTNSLRVPKASTYNLILTDGTKVTLNSDSKLTYPSKFSESDRTVFLEGEAYFEVKKTVDHRKFIVQTNMQRIEVLGTKFNVKAYETEQKQQTSLEEGSVLVHNNAKDEDPRLLKPNQQATNSKNQSLSVQVVDMENILAWKDGKFNFDGVNTEEVLKEIARWYDIDIVYSNSYKNTNQFKGKIPRNITLDKLIKLLNFAEVKTEATISKNQRIKLQLL